MAVRIVDALEVVEVEYGQGEGRAGALGALYLHVEHPVEGAAVGQPGERVVVGLVGQRLQRGLKLLEMGERVAVNGQGEPLAQVVPVGQCLPLLGS